MYAQDYDETFPGAWVGYPQTIWAHTVLPYIKNVQIFTCPSRPNQWWSGGLNNRPGTFRYGMADTRLGYGINAAVDDQGRRGGVGRIGNDGTRGYSFGAIVAPAECYLAADSRLYYPRAYGDSVSYSIADYNYAEAPAFRHNQNANMVFVDGHAKVVKRKTVMEDCDARRFWFVDNSPETAWCPPFGMPGTDDSPYY